MINEQVFIIKVENNTDAIKPEENVLEVKDFKQENPCTENTLVSVTTSKPNKRKRKPKTNKEGTKESSVNILKVENITKALDPAFQEIQEESSSRFTGYTKRRILNHLQTEGPCGQNLENLIQSFKVNREIVYGHFNEGIQNAQNFVHQECGSMCFSNITSWLDYMKNMGVPEHCSYEPAIVLNGIVENAQHPDPSEIGGIDLKAIYKFLENSSLGLPSTEMDTVSAKFLATEFENLINEANTDEADIKTCRIKNQLEYNVRSILEPSSVDPFNLSNAIN